MLRVPAEVEQALWAATRSVLPAQAIKGKTLHRAIANRSRIYTTDRAKLMDGADHPDADLAARALFFSIADAAKIMTPLAELAGRGLVPEGAPLRILDLGAGVGAASFGVWSWLRGCGDERELRVRAVDLDGRALAIFEQAARQLDSRLSVERVVSSLERPGWGEGYDLVVASTVLNELAPEVQRDILKRSLAAVAPTGAVIFIEPALRETSRALHELRDWVISDQLAHVFAPCSRRDAPCPALAQERDWCHEDRSTQLPSRASDLARVTGLRTKGLKFSYLTLRKELGALAASDALRVVSQPRKLKGRREFFVCSDAGWQRGRLLKRNRSAANVVVDDARRGDLLVTTGAADIGLEDEVSLLTYRDQSETKS